MTQDELRETIVWAAMPLIGEYDTLTTGRIAQAAGVDEAALLTVFEDKDAVVRACMDAMRAEIGAAFDPGEALQRLDAVPVDQPVAARLVAVIDIMDAYYDRARARFDGVRRPAGPGQGAAGEPGARSLSRDDFRAIGSLPETRQAVARLLEPDQDRLRLPAGVLAEAFLGMSLGGARAPHPDRSPLPAEQLVDLFLHGAQTD